MWIQMFMTSSRVVGLSAWKVALVIIVTEVLGFAAVAACRTCGHDPVTVVREHLGRPLMAAVVATAD